MVKIFSKVTIQRTLNIYLGRFNSEDERELYYLKTFICMHDIGMLIINHYKFNTCLYNKILNDDKEISNKIAIKIDNYLYLQVVIRTGNYIKYLK